MRPYVLVACLWLLPACAAPGSPTGAGSAGPTGGAAPAPAGSLEALEQRLVAAQSVRFRARLATSGRIQSHFEGEVALGPGRRMRVAMQGAFGGKDLDALFTSDGTHMRAGRAPAVQDVDAPPGLRDSVVVAFVRCGLTHDVATLSGGELPTAVDGTARQHLEAVAVAHAPGEPVRGAATERWTWELHVDGKHTADETLWLDARTGLPLRRRVVVHFPEGDMEVGEDYEDFAVDGPVPEETFRLAP